MQSLARGSPAAIASVPPCPSCTAAPSPTNRPVDKRPTRSRHRGQPFSAGQAAPQPRLQNGEREGLAASPPTPGPPAHRRSPKILLVDDNPVHRKLALGILRQVGLQTDVAADGREALACLTGAAYDLVLMDCQMPVMDGYATTRLIRDPASPVLDHAIPVIALTAHTSEADRRACLAAGMNDFVPKPLTRFALVVTIKRWSFAGAPASPTA